MLFTKKNTKPYNVYTIVITFFTLSLLPASIDAAQTAFTYKNTDPKLLPIAHYTTAIIGNRNTMEDMHFPGGDNDLLNTQDNDLLNSQDNDPLNTQDNNPLIAPDSLFYAIYDGHGGIGAAKFCAQNLHKKIIEHHYFNDVPEKSLYDAFIKTHEAYKNAGIYNIIPRDGATAVAALIKNNKLYVANCGDARAVLCTNNKAKRLSFDHKPGDATETARIKEAHKPNETEPIVSHETAKHSTLIGFCSRTGTQVIEKIESPVFRVVGKNSALSVARAIGDFSFNPLIIPNPHVSVTPLTGSEDLLILGCDGFFDVVGDQEAADLALYYLAKIKAESFKLFGYEEHEKIAKRISIELVKMAYETLKSSDNITVTVILFPKCLDIEPLKNTNTKFPITWFTPTENKIPQIITTSPLCPLCPSCTKTPPEFPLSTNLDTTA